MIRVVFIPDPDPGVKKRHRIPDPQHWWHQGGMVPVPVCIIQLFFLYAFSGSWFLPIPDPGVKNNGTGSRIHNTGDIKGQVLRIHDILGVDPDLDPRIHASG